MLDQGVRQERDGDFVDFWETGSEARGQFACADCGYGVSVQTRLPSCPMCGGRSWEQSPASPFSRSTYPL